MECNSLGYKCTFCCRGCGGCYCFSFVHVLHFIDYLFTNKKLLSQTAMKRPDFAKAPSVHENTKSKSNSQPSFRPHCWMLVTPASNNWVPVAKTEVLLSYPLILWLLLHQCCIRVLLTLWLLIWNQSPSESKMLGVLCNHGIYSLVKNSYISLASAINDTINQSVSQSKLQVRCCSKDLSVILYTGCWIM